MAFVATTALLTLSFLGVLEAAFSLEGGEPVCLRVFWTAGVLAGFEDTALATFLFGLVFKAIDLAVPLRFNGDFDFVFSFVAM